MVATPSTMLELGTRMPDFELPDVVTHQRFNTDSFAGSRGSLVMFICNHCPYVRHVIDELDRLASEYMAQGVAVVAVSSNDAEAYPDDGPEPMKELAVERGWKFAYLYDESQEVAKAFRAACTPDFFLFDAEQRLVYRGQLDDSRPKNETPVSGRDLRAALDAVLAGQPVPPEQKPSIGCNIKWKPGNEPSYFG